MKLSLATVELLRDEGDVSAFHLVRNVERWRVVYGAKFQPRYERGCLFAVFESSNVFVEGGR